VFTFAVRKVKQFSLQSTPEATVRVSRPTVIRKWVPDRWRSQPAHRRNFLRIFGYGGINKKW